MKKQGFHILLIILLSCLIMAFVDGIIKPNYLIKSIIKIVLFLIIPIGYALLTHLSFKTLFIFNKRSLLFSIFLGIGVYLFILATYFILGPFFDFSNITDILQGNLGVSKDNFIFVALYISFINSLLEEFFFRGFGFLSLKKIISRRFAYLFSALVFSLYHIAIITSWFTPFLFILLILSLFVAGLMFNYLNEKTSSIYTSWMVHMSSNFAINTIGFMLFGII